MAGDRNFFKRSFEIIGGTAVEIGKDYTSNISSFITDANDIKNTVIRGAIDAKSQFQNMRKGSGPIKGLMDWFYTKESEFDMFDLDNDSDFDPGTSFGEPEDDDKGPATLDVKGAEKVAKGHISSMFKIASKIAETQVANTAEIITTINSRTSEIVAATNNINTTLLGISKKLDAVTVYINARSRQQQESNRYDSLTDSNGRFTLGATWDAAKRGFESGGFGTAKSLLSTMKMTGGFTPEAILRLAFDWTLGDKEFKALGDQSLNQLGKNFNDALGQSISDALSNVMDTKFFKKLFGDLKAESRSNDFRRYTTNEYNREPAVFDGMTRTSIIKTIPEYLRKIYEGISGKTLNVGKRGELTEKEGMTFKSLTSDALFGRSAFDSDILRGYLSNDGRNSGLDQYTLNTIGQSLTGGFIYLMNKYNIRVIDKRYLNPDDDSIVGPVAAYYSARYGVEPRMAYNQVKSFLSYVYRDRGMLNKVIGEINYNYERARKKLEDEVRYVNDIENVREITQGGFENALGLRLDQRAPMNVPKPEQMKVNVQNFLNDVHGTTGSGDPNKIFGSGNSLKIYAGDGTNPEIDAQRTINENLSDIRELLSVTTKQMIGAKKYSSVASKLTKPTRTASSVNVGEYDENDYYTPTRPDFSDGKASDLIDAFKQTKRDAATNIKGAISPDGSTNALTKVYDAAGRFIG